MSFHWSCFIVPSCLEICSFIVILVCLSLFHSVYAQKKNKKKQKKNKKTKTKTKKKKTIKKNKRKKKKKKKREKEKIYMNKCAHICIQYKYSLSPYVDL